MFTSYLRYNTDFHSGSMIMLQLKNEDSYLQSLKKNIKLYLEQNNVKIYRMEIFKNTIYIECDSQYWRTILNPVINKSLVINHYNRKTHSHCKHSKTHYFISFTIKDKDKYLSSILNKNVKLLYQLLNTCTIHVEKNRYINIYVPHFTDIENIKRKLEFSGKFTVRYYYPGYRYFEYLNSIETMDRKPKGTALFNNISFPNLVKKVIGNENGYITAQLHPSLLEKLNKMSFKHQNCHITFDMDDKLLFEQELYYDCLQMENVVAVIKNSKTQENIINFLNLSSPLDQFKIISVKKSEPMENSKLILFFLILLLICLLGLAILNSKSKMQKALNFILLLLICYTNYLYLFISITMFLITYCDILLLIFNDTINNVLCKYSKYIMLTCMLCGISLTMLFFYTLNLYYMWIVKHYWYFVCILLFKSIINIF